ncbi:MAG TPA: hypothetical protein VN109_12410 [Devosia sp.]|jgi:hypothetical protein|nr:hypothetical protein [Devosia sp.]
MTGVSLSRWTMSYFAAALAALLAAEVLMLLGFGFPSASVEAPETLVLVHLVALGWLSLLLCGALFQFVPVLVAKPLHDNRLPFATLCCLLAGLALLLCGFLQLNGSSGSDWPLLPAGGSLLAVGFALVLYNLGRTLWAGRPLPLPARFVVAGLCSVAAAASLGVIFTYVLAGFATAAPLTALTASGLPLHIAAGIGGWLTFTAMGVSYRLLAMFMLSPEEKRGTSLAAFWGGVGVLVLAVGGGGAAILMNGDPAPILAAAAVLMVPVLAVYGWDVAWLYNRRKRRRLETNSLMAAPALASLAMGAALLLALLALGQLPRFAGAVIYLLAFGWLSGLGLSQLYKIVAFVTWLECYGPVLGRMPTPRVQDLVVESRARTWFYLYFGTVWLGTIALLFDQELAFRWLALVLLLATGGLIVEFVRTRRLADIDLALRGENAPRRPRLLYALVAQH